MKKDDIKLGGTYLAKVTDKVVPVRLDTENPHGGWDATNLATNKKVRIKSAQRLRGPAPDRQASQRARAVAEAQAADAAANAHATPAPRRMAEVAAEAQQAQMASEAKPGKTKKAPAEKKPKKVSGLDAAFEVLKAKGEPMACKAIVDEMLAKGMWKTGGKTPSATIYSAMLREIDTKPGESRFKKVDRGLFTVATPRN